jgi:hypothetical protein
VTEDVEAGPVVPAVMAASKPVPQSVLLSLYHLDFFLAIGTLTCGGLSSCMLYWMLNIIQQYWDAYLWIVIAEMVSDVCLCLAEKDVSIIPKPRAKAAAKKVTKPVMVLILLYQCACQY